MLASIKRTPRSILLTICFSVKALLIVQQYRKVFLALGDKLLKWKHLFVLVVQARNLLFSLFNTFVYLSRAIIMLNQYQPCFPANSGTNKTLNPAGPSIGLDTSRFQYLEHQFVVALKVLTSCGICYCLVLSLLRNDLLSLSNAGRTIKLVRAFAAPIIALSLLTKPIC